MRKLLLFLVPGLIIALGLTWYFMDSKTTTYIENSAFMAVPVRTPIVIEIPDLQSLVNAVKGNDPMVQEIRTADFLSSFWADLDGVENLLAENEILRQTLLQKPVLVAFNPEGKSEIGAMFAFSLKNSEEKNDLVAFVKKQQQEGAGKLSQRNYDGEEVFQFKADGINYAFSEVQGIFLFSRNVMFVEEGIRQIKSENLLSKEQFKKLYNTVGSGSAFNIFVNHKKLAILLDKIINPEFRKVIRQFANFSDWSELDVSLKESQAWLNGFSVAGETYDNYLNVLKNQEGQRFRMDAVLSDNTSMFVNFNLENFEQFQDDYQEFLKKQGSAFYNRETSLTAIERTGRKAIIPLFKEISDNDFAVAYGSVLQNDPTLNRFFIAKVKSQSAAKELLLPVMDRFAQVGKKAQAEINYQLQKDVVYTIYEFPISNLPELLLGHVCSSVATNYLCFYDNYLIFADNITALKNYIHDLALSATLEKDVNFKKFQAEMASRSSIYFYLNVSKAFHLGSHYFNEEVAGLLVSNEQLFRKFYALGWQISANSGAFLNNMYVRFEPVLKEDPQTVWQSKLDTTIWIKPQLVANHNDKLNKEVIVQDNKNNLYLINKEGVGLWKIKLPGKILGDVHQVDYYRNGKLQYLFNTAEKLFLIDRNGNNVAKFPVSFRSPATNGVALFDYDDNRDYRYFVACENKQIYAYDRDGKLVTGWNASKTEEIITNPLQHLRIEGKDYLVAADRNKTYILDRQGNSRVKSADNFEHSSNDVYLVKAGQAAIAATDLDGLVHLLYFTGESKTLDLGSFSKEHYFVAEDLNNDGQSDYVIAQGNRLTAYTDKGKKILEKEFRTEITSRPYVYTFAGNAKKLGVVCGGENRVYLVNMDGTLHDGFPLQGNTDFSIGYLTVGNTYFNLLVGNEDNSFFNYKVE